MEKTHQSEPTPEEIERGYEIGDVSVKAAVWVTVAFIAFGIVTHVFLTLVWKATYRQAEVIDQPRSAVVDERPPAFAPPLQPSLWHDTTPYEDTRNMIKAENKVFESIGWKVEPRTKDQTEMTPTARIPDAILAKVQARAGQPATRPAGGNR
jgi:hypothetical protein